MGIIINFKKIVVLITVLMGCKLLISKNDNVTSNQTKTIIYFYENTDLINYDSTAYYIDEQNPDYNLNVLQSIVNYLNDSDRKDSLCIYIEAFSNYNEWLKFGDYISYKRAIKVSDMLYELGLPRSRVKFRINSYKGYNEEYERNNYIGISFQTVKIFFY